MELQTNIKSFDSSNFLNSGAFIRWKGTWYLYELQKDFSKKIENSTKSVVCRNFFDSNSCHFPVLSGINWDTRTWNSHWKSEGPSTSLNWLGPSRELYSRSFQSVQAKIGDKKWLKGVPVSFDRADYQIKQSDLIFLLSQVSSAPDNLLPFGMWNSSGGVLGATPELIYYRHQRSVESMALAGTQSKDGPCRLLEDSKNMKEHQFVVQELLQKWKQWGKVTSHPTEILELPLLYHLITKFQILLNQDVSDDQLTEAFHPTSALGVFPYERWRELKELPEQGDRRNFGAPIVFPLSQTQESVAIVSLRQIQWNQEQIILGAGGGVVQESQEELEWNEILAKMNSVKKLLKI